MHECNECYFKKFSETSEVNYCNNEKAVRRYKKYFKKIYKKIYVRLLPDEKMIIEKMHCPFSTSEKEMKQKKEQIKIKEKNIIKKRIQALNKEWYK